MKTNLNWNIAFLGALLILAGNTASAQKFTIPVLPDTQESLTRQRGVFFSQIEWITAKADSLKTPMVLHVGDLVNFDNFDHWELGSVGMRVLDRANIPYAISLGNHDTGAVGMHSGSAAPGNVNVNLRNTQKFNYFFPVTRFPLQRGRFEKDKSDNSYYTFETGNVKWMVVTLEFCAREEAAQWMDKVLKEHPDRNAIILTHYHLTSKGEICDNNAGYGDMKVIDIFERYIKPNKNVLMVLSGHVCGSAWRVDRGTKGNDIYQILQNFQCKEEGYLRLLDIDTEKGTISAKLYSPYLNKIRDDEKSAFSFSDVKFIR
ncbi:metallophosphoesterase [Proteiniphilum sp. X52]|uniref:metallophosphoesterase n=1 Tax=Proteiniphilum sp. X52 TaxID=2382159 RepID=UPI000F0A655E|nr:metallophosphoesterase [Proteiniphilum sp. X52]RNC63395.1 metallophosphoesterase [Proteiniphilum sp. X52]